MADCHEIIVSEHAGFCPGVKGVLLKIDRALAEGARPVFTFGPAIHNPGVVRKYEEKGAGVIHSASEAPDGATVIIRAHGLPRKDREELGSRNIVIIDGTCPKVKIVQETIRETAESGRSIIMAGYPGHAETAAHISLFPEKMLLISAADELDGLSLPAAPVALLAQTSFDSIEFDKIRKMLEAKSEGKLSVINTICPVAAAAQEDAARIAARADAMIVIGGRNSSNTLRLVDRCREACENVFLMESPEELDAAGMRKFKIIGVTAGASTPPEDIEAVVSSLRNA